MLSLEYSFETDQGKIRYGMMGEGEPLILIHGTPWSSFTYHKLVPVLAQSYRVYYYDLIGYGLSEMRAGQRVSLDIQSQIFANLIQHWGLDNPMVIAHDFGGAISLRAHLLQGQDYKKLVLMNVVAMAPWGSPFFAHVQKHETAFAGVPPYIHKAIVETYIRGALYGSLVEPDFEALVQPWLSPEGQAAFYRQIAQADQKYTDEVESLYGNIRCPVQILWGEDDEWIPIETGRRLHVAIPQSTFHAIEHAGHLVQLDNPEAITGRIQKFLTKQTG